MLTRLRVKGFKSLIDSEVRFGPFTCIAGANGAGKSNLFDAILFLRDLADHSIIEAAHRVRDRNGGRKGDLRSLFTKTIDQNLPNISIEADFIVANEVTDDFGRKAKPSTTFLTYKIELKYVIDSDFNERIELVSEHLTYLPKSSAKKRIGFSCSKEFFNSALAGERRAPFITTEQDSSTGSSTINVSQDGNSGRPSQIPAQNSPRTVLGSANTDERPTVLAARREMQSWKLLQLEPSRLRSPDEFSDDPHITFDGAHIPSTLERLKRYEEISNRVATLLPEVRGVSVDVDNTRRIKTLLLEQRNGVVHQARSLSDGTLRFLALATMAFDSDSKGLICFEEPENGIHPSRINAILELLREMAVNTQIAVSTDNPLRQVIINTHSPVVVRNLTPDELLVAVPIRKNRSSFTAYGAIVNSWRLSHPDHQSELTPKVTVTELLDYLRNSDDVPEDDLNRGKLWQLASEQGMFDFEPITTK
ncbi:AAA family ATPase [Acidovorax sp. 106]|uniref:AAA family ATPase n=1 Tax=Acidovorax sp. 106 TaxID=2135637 RepID=UPI000EB151AA|nr:AAA family ATPase [Acidovorax sp. 106]RLJ39742.1 putative ATPase [Acidovorax sp. 106]